MEYNKQLEEVRNELIEIYSPKAIGIFGSNTNFILPSSDVDLYVFSDHEERQVLRKQDLIFETYFVRPELISRGIEDKNIEVVDRMRKSRIIYDPSEIYHNLVERAKSVNLRKEEWREKTIIGGEYDLVERVKFGCERAITNGQLESAILQVRSLVDRIVDIGLRRKNVSGHANPKEKYSLITEHLPSETLEIYNSATFFSLKNEKDLRSLLALIEKNKMRLLPDR